MCFSTLADQGASDSSQLKVTSPRKGEFQLSPKSLFTSRIEHSDTSIIADSRPSFREPSFREPIVSTEGTNSEANSPIPVLDEVLGDTMATSTAVPSIDPAPLVYSSGVVVNEVDDWSRIHYRFSK